ncbi:hypothetical protein PGSY75_1452600 [Plasmodium gaboni]|uniref:Mon2/Sec7/BIG1-like dimerisation and cyclophilin-binding domain-containing protein n=1 Tax=Plasmodium gaboni TaxID=647221 RepID=A0A151LAX3_9APIC|nr:hypothetical protein PGSY75_1452600 [Plasmodium gaboni]KYN96115.1 hypothetical protein PGSY75_1452600 [Plasmodium gaboni]
MDSLSLLDELEHDLTSLILESKKKNICVKEKTEICIVKIKNYNSILEYKGNQLLCDFEFPLNDILEIINICMNINSYKINNICLSVIQKIVLYILCLIDNKELINKFDEINIEKHIEIITNKLFDLTFLEDRKILIKILQIILTAFSSKYIEYYNKDNINTILKILYSIYYSSLYDKNLILYQTCCAAYEQLLNSLIDVCNKEGFMNMDDSSNINLSEGTDDNLKKKKKKKRKKKKKESREIMIVNEEEKNGISKTEYMENNNVNNNINEEYNNNDNNRRTDVNKYTNDQNSVQYYFENFVLPYNTNDQIDLIYINNMDNNKNMKNKNKLLSLIHYLCYCCFVNIRSKYNTERINDVENRKSREEEYNNNDDYKEEENCEELNKINNKNNEHNNNGDMKEDINNNMNYKHNNDNNYMINNIVDNGKDYGIKNRLSDVSKCSSCSNTKNEEYNKNFQGSNNINSFLIEEKTNVVNKDEYNKSNISKNEDINNMNNMYNVKNSNIKKFFKILKSSNSKNSSNDNVSNIKYNETFHADSSELKTDILSSYNKNNLILPFNFCLDLLYIFLNNYEYFLDNFEFFKLLKFEVIYIILISLKYDLDIDVFYRCLKILKIICNKYFVYFLAEIQYLLDVLQKYLCLVKPFSKLYIVLNFFFYLFDNTSTFFYLYKYFYYYKNANNKCRSKHEVDIKEKHIPSSYDCNEMENVKKQVSNEKNKDSENIIFPINIKNKISNNVLDTIDNTNNSVNKMEDLYNNEENKKLFNNEDKIENDANNLNHKNQYNDNNDFIFTRIVEYISKIIHELLFLHTIDITKMYPYLKVIKYDRIYTTETRFDDIINKLKENNININNNKNNNNNNSNMNDKKETPKKIIIQEKIQTPILNNEEEKDYKEIDEKKKKYIYLHNMNSFKDEKQLSFCNFLSYPIILPNAIVNPKEDFYLSKFSTEKFMCKILFDDLLYKDVDEIRLLASSVDSILSLVNSFYIIFLNILKKDNNPYCFSTVDMNDERIKHHLENFHMERTNVMNSNIINNIDNSNNVNQLKIYNNDNYNNNKYSIYNLKNEKGHDKYTTNMKDIYEIHAKKETSNFYYSIHQKIQYYNHNDYVKNGFIDYSKIEDKSKDIYQDNNNTSRTDHNDEYNISVKKKEFENSYNILYNQVNINLNEDKSLFFYVFNSTCRFIISCICLIFSYTNTLDVCFFNGFQKLIFISSNLNVNICTDACLKTLTKCSSIFTLENSPFFLNILKNFEKQENKNENNIKAKKNKSGSKTGAYKMTSVQASNTNKGVSPIKRELYIDDIYENMDKNILPCNNISITHMNNVNNKNFDTCEDMSNTNNYKDNNFNDREELIKCVNTIVLNKKKKKKMPSKNNEHNDLSYESNEEQESNTFNRNDMNMDESKLNDSNIKHNNKMNGVKDINVDKYNVNHSIESCDSLEKETVINNNESNKEMLTYYNINNMTNDNINNLKENFSKRLSVESIELNFLTYKRTLNDDLLKYFDDIISVILQESYYINNDLNNIKYILSIKAVISIYYIYGDYLHFDDWLKLINLFVEINYIYKYIASIENKTIQFLNFFHHINKNEEDISFPIDKYDSSDVDRNNNSQKVDSKSIEFCYFILRFIQKNPVLCAEITVIFSSFDYFFKNTIFYNISTLINIINSIHYMIFNQFFKEKRLGCKKSNKLLNKEEFICMDKKNNSALNHENVFVINDYKGCIVENNYSINDPNNNNEKTKRVLVDSIKVDENMWNEVNQKKNVINKYFNFLYKSKDIFEIFYFYLSHFEPIYKSYFQYYSDIFFIKKKKKNKNNNTYPNDDSNNNDHVNVNEAVDTCINERDQMNHSYIYLKNDKYIVLKKLEESCIFEDFYPLYILETLCVININKIRYIYNNCCIDILLLSLCKNNDIQKKSIDTLYNIIKESVVYYKSNFEIQFLLFKPFFFFIVNPYISYRSYFMTSFLNFIRKNGSFFYKDMWLFVIYLLYVSLQKELKKKNLKQKSHIWKEEINEEMKRKDDTIKADNIREYKNYKDKSKLNDKNEIDEENISIINNIFNILEIIIVDYIEDVPVCEIMEIIIHMLMLFSSLNILSNNISFRAINFSWTIVDYIIDRSNLINKNINNDNKKDIQTNGNNKNMVLEKKLLHICVIENKKMYIYENKIKMKNIKMKNFFIFILYNLMKLCLDERIEVRNCSIKTIMSILSAHIYKFDFFFYKTSICLLLKRLTLTYFYKLQEYFKLEKKQDIQNHNVNIIPHEELTTICENNMRNNNMGISPCDVLNNNKKDIILNEPLIKDYIHHDINNNNNNNINSKNYISTHENVSKNVSEKNEDDNITLVYTNSMKKYISSNIKDQFKNSFLNICYGENMYDVVKKKKEKKNEKKKEKKKLLEDIDMNINIFNNNNNNNNNLLEDDEKNCDLYDYVNENFNKIIIHHSRDSKLKQWIESFILIIEGCNRILLDQDNYKKFHYFYDIFIKILKTVLFIEYNNKNMFELHISIIQILNNIFMSKLNYFGSSYFKMKNYITLNKCNKYYVNIFDKSFFYIYKYAPSIIDQKIKDFILKIIIDNLKTITSDKWIFYHSIIYFHMFHFLFPYTDVNIENEYHQNKKEKKHEKNYSFLNYYSIVNKLYFDYFISTSDYLNENMIGGKMTNMDNKKNNNNININNNNNNSYSCNNHSSSDLILNEDIKLEKDASCITHHNMEIKKNISLTNSTDEYEKPLFTKNAFTFDYKTEDSSKDPLNIYNILENNKDIYNIKYNILSENFIKKNIYEIYLNNNNMITSDLFKISMYIFETLEYDDINLLINEELLNSLKLLKYHFFYDEEKMVIYKNLIDFFFNDNILLNENNDEILDKIELNDTYNKQEIDINDYQDKKQEYKECNRLFTLNYKKLYPLNNYVEGFQIFQIAFFNHFIPCYIFFIHNKFNLYPNYQLNSMYSIILCNMIKQEYYTVYYHDQDLLVSFLNMFPYILATHLKCFLYNLKNNSCFVFYESIIILLKITYQMVLNSKKITKKNLYKYWYSVIFAVEKILFVNCSNDKIDMLDIMLIKFIRNNYLSENSVTPWFIKIYLTKIISELYDKKRRAFSSWTLQILFEEYEKMSKNNNSYPYYTTFITILLLKKCVLTLKSFSSQNNKENTSDEIIFILYEMKKLKCSYSFINMDSSAILKSSDEKAHLFICYPYLLDCLNTENKNVFTTVKELLKLISYPLRLQ